MSTVAVFIALGGSAFAALQITGKNVRNGSLTGADIKRESLGPRQIHGLRAGDLAPGTLLAGRTGPKGDPGPKGDTGLGGSRGPQGPPGPTQAGSLYASSATSSGCTPTPLLTKQLTATTQGVLQVTGSASYATTTGLRTGELSVVLQDAGGTTTVATTDEALSSDFTTGAGNRLAVVITGLLGTPEDHSVAYVVPAGTYRIALMGNGADGSCVGTETWWRPNMSWLLAAGA